MKSGADRGYDIIRREGRIRLPKLPVCSASSRIISLMIACPVVGSMSPSPLTS